MEGDALAQPLPDGAAPGGDFQRDTAMRMELNNHAINIVRCDGRLKEDVRKWLDDVTAAKGWSQATDRATLKMVGYTSCGQL